MPRKPKPKLTPKERAEQNRKNSQLSTGPRTECGKAASARNSYKHGLCAKEFLLDTESLERLEQLTAHWNDCYRPRTPGRQALVDRCVFTQAQFFRGISAITATVNEQIAVAEIDWERGQQEEVKRNTEMLATDPAAAVAGLFDTAAGCRWLLAQ